MTREPRQRLRIEVEGLHCEGCAENLREELGQLPGFELLRVDVGQRCLVAELDPETADRDRLLEELRRAGFPPRGVERVEAVEETPREAPRGRTGSYLLFVLVVLGMAVAGYLGYEIYPRFDLPPLEGATLLLHAAGAASAPSGATRCSGSGTCWPASAERGRSWPVWPDTPSPPAGWQWPGSPSWWLRSPWSP